MACAITHTVFPWADTARPSWWERVEFCSVLTIPTPPILAYYSNLVLDKRPGAAAERDIAAIELATTAGLGLLHSLARCRPISVF